MTIVEDEKIVEDSEAEKIPKMEENLSSSDITKILKSADYWTVDYPNGLVLGIRPIGIPSTRDVHLDVVHVLDLRRAKFGRSNLAVQAAILESVNRPVENLLRDVEMDGLIDTKSLLSPLGRIEFKVLRSLNKDSISKIHETRTIYAIFKEGSSNRDFSWLTDISRILPDNELPLLLSSDSRSQFHAVQTSVNPDKWNDLESGYKKAWFGVLPVLMGIFSGLGIFGSLLAGGSLLIPLIVCSISIPLALWIFKNASSDIKSFQDSLNSELKEMVKIGDAERVEAAIAENTTSLEIVGTLNFIITPLMHSAAEAMERGDVDGSIISLCSVLDECVRFAPLSPSSELTLSGDPGLEKFITLFKNLGLAFQEGEEEALGLAYVALTGHSSSPVMESELIEHLGTLNNLLFDIGALSPEVKNKIDDLLNFRAGGKMIEKLNQELAKPDDFEALISTESALSDEERALHDEIAETYPIERLTEKTEDESGSAFEPEPEESEDDTSLQPSEESHPVIVAETVSEGPNEIVQATLGPEEVPETGDTVVKRARKRERSRKELAHIRSAKQMKERGMAEY